MLTEKSASQGGHTADVTKARGALINACENRNSGSEVYSAIESSQQQPGPYKDRIGKGASEQAFSQTAKTSALKDRLVQAVSNEQSAQTPLRLHG